MPETPTDIVPSEQNLNETAQSAVEMLKNMVSQLFDMMGDKPGQFLWEQVTLSTWIQAVLILTFGIVCILYGWRVFKILAVVALAILGAMLGSAVGKYFNHGSLGAVAGLIGFGLLTLPLMNWAVRFLGTLVAGFTLAGLAFSAGAQDIYVLAAFIIGMLVGLIFSFLLFKSIIILSTSFAGGVLTVTGSLAALYLIESGAVAEPHIANDLIFKYQWFVPLMTIGAMIAGFVSQNKLAKAEKKEKKDKD